MMGTPVAVLSGGTRGFELGLFKNGSVAQGFNFPLTTNYKWWNGVDVLSSQYLIYTDKYTMGSSTLADTIPVAWSTPDLNDSSLLALINTLPPRVGLPGFTDLDAALNWLDGTDDFFLLKNGIENIVTTNLEVYWDAGLYSSYVGTGTQWTDLSGNNRTGTLNNSPVFNTSGVGTFNFDGTDDYAITTGPNLTNQATFSCWFKTTSSQTNKYLMAMAKVLSAGQNGIDIYFDPTNVGSYLATASSFANPTFTTNYFDGQWHMVTVTFDGSNAKLYYDGILRTTSSLSGSLSLDPVRNLTVGSWANGSVNVNASIPIAQVYSLALSSDQVLQNYNAQKGRFGLYGQVTTGQVLKLDASNPVSYPGSGTNWYDISGYGNNAELINGPTFSSEGGGSISFDGTDDRARIPQTNSLYGNTFTWEFWVKFDTFPNYYSGIVWAEGALGGGSGLQYLFSLAQGVGGFFHYRISNTITGWANTDTSQINFNPTEWTHIVWSFNNGITNIYIQGNLFHSNNTRGSYNGGTDSPIFLGGRNDSFGSLDGKYGLTNYYSRVLSTPEIVQNFESKRNQFSVTGVTTNGLVLWLDGGNYASYNGSGTTWYDISGSMIDGRLLNGVTYSTDGGGSFVFDGADDYVSCGTSIPPAGNISVFDWVYVTTFQNPWNILITKWFDPSASDFHWALKNDGTGYKQNLYTTNNSDMYGNTIFSTGTWYYVGFTLVNGGTLTFYVNGNTDGTHSSVSRTPQSSNLIIGDNRNVAYGLVGKMGTVQIYNRTLSGSEVLQNFNAQKNRYGL